MWLLIGLSILLMLVDHHYHKLDQVRSALSWVVYPLQWGVDAPVHLAYKIQDYLVSQHRLVNENQALRQEQWLQNGRLQKLLALEAENARLRSLLNTAAKHQDEALTIAEILQVDSDPFHHRIILNKGKKDHVYVGQPIIDAQGIMGDITEVNELTSSAMLLTDASHAIPVENARNGVRGIVAGTGSIDALELRYVPLTADIQVGDTLVTSGLGGRYPAGYPVGVIANISRDRGDSFALLHIKPAAHLERGRQVLLIEKKVKGLEEKSD